MTSTPYPRSSGERAAASAVVIPVRLPAAGIRQDLRAVKVVCHRELIRFWHDKARIVSSLLQPLLFLFVLGTGLSSLAPRTGEVNYRTFLFPGVLATSVLFTAVFSGVSMVWDREFGFLREMLVAPVRRWAIVVGKCLGGAIVATLQSFVLIALGGVVGVPYSVGLMLELALLLFVISFSVTAFGLVLAARVTKMQTLMPIIQLILAPMMFLSGAMFPLVNLPIWLTALTMVNPLTYAVGPMRALVFGHLNLDPVTRAALDPGVSWWGWHVPELLQVAMVIGIGGALLAVAAALFSRTE